MSNENKENPVSELFKQLGLHPDCLLGEIAYNAYCKTREWKSFNGQPLPFWKDVSRDIQNGWIESAAAVRKALE